MLPSNRALALTAALTTLSLVGCNAVLGIDEAHLASETGGKVFNSGSRVAPQFAEKCVEPTAACSACLSAGDCNITAKPTCLMTAECRGGLNNYRSCLANPCSDPNGECLGQLAKAESKLGSSLGFSQCVQNTCATECEGSPLVSPCELYCGCMVNNCSDAQYLGKLGNNFTECVQSCKDVQPSDLLCRWTHCEMAPAQSNVDHCLHALGGGGFCKGVTASEPNCTELSQDQFICDRSSDCCSNNCDAQHICQPSQ